MAKQPKPMTVGEAIFLAIQPRSQKDVAEAIKVAPSTVTRWIQGSYTPGYQELADIEKACGRPPGFILGAAGYIANVTTVPEALAVDPDLDDAGRAALLRGYKAAVEHRRKVIASEKAGDGGPLGL